jgi:curli biogenesis system outer membrane secretion channel CsgG
MLPVVLAAILGGCQQRPETATVASQPRTAPVRTITSFDEPLRCMDDMFWAQGKKDIYLTSAGIPDATGMIAAGTKEMLITAVSKMSAKSGAFRFVDFDPTQIDVQALTELVGIRPDFTAPNYYIRGAITQLDSNVLSSKESAALSVPWVDLAVSRDQVVSVISIDLNLGKLVTRQILPGMSASNSIAVVRAGQGADAGGVIGKAGIALNISLDRSEGFHQAVRNLVELSTIEILGKLARVPYWQCLEIDQSNPTFKAEARGWFDGMSGDERARFVSASLARAGYYRGGAASETDGALRDAVARYQARSDLIPTGRIDFDLYYRLLGSNAQVAGTPGRIEASARVPVIDAPPRTPPTPDQPPALILGTARGPRPAYRIDETFVLQAQPTRDGFLYSYYQDAERTVARIFPNRFQPDAFVRANAQVEIPPGPEPPFNIRFDKRGSREAVACVASDLELGLKLPEDLKVRDLEPLPVHSLNEVVDKFRAIGGAHVTDGWLPIEVQR